MLEKTLERPLDWKEINPVNPKGNQPWIFTGRTDAEASILWPPDVKSLLNGKKTLMLGKVEGKKRRRGQKMRWLNNITDSIAINLNKLREIVKDRGAWHAAVHGVTELDMSSITHKTQTITTTITHKTYKNRQMNIWTQNEEKLSNCKSW